MQGSHGSDKRVDFVLLMGPRACGKTTVAKSLETELEGWNHLDLDTLYESRRPKANSLRVDLDTYYDDLQTLLLENIHRPNLILSASGGSLVNRQHPFGRIEILTACKSRGKMVLLLPSRFDFRNRAILYRRELQRDYGLPRDAKSKLKATSERNYDERIMFFRGNADLIVHGSNPTTSARRIITAFGLQPPPSKT